MVPSIRAPKNKITNTANRTFAIEAAPSEIPPNPKIAATIAITKKIADHLSIIYSISLRLNYNRAEKTYALIR